MEVFQALFGIITVLSGFLLIGLIGTILLYTCPIWLPILIVVGIFVGVTNGTKSKK